MGLFDSVYIVSLAPGVGPEVIGTTPEEEHQTKDFEEPYLDSYQIVDGQLVLLDAPVREPEMGYHGRIRTSTGLRLKFTDGHLVQVERDGAAIWSQSCWGEKDEDSCGACGSPLHEPWCDQGCDCRGAEGKVAGHVRSTPKTE